MTTLSPVYRSTSTFPQFTDLTEEQKQILMGAALGDGSIEERKKDGFVMYIGHEAKQKSWVEYKADKLQPLVNDKGIVFNSTELKGDRYTKSDKSEKYAFRTIPHPFITELHRLVTVHDKDGKSRKTLLNIFPLLDAAGLATLLGDDGSTHFINNNPNQFKYCRFCLNGYPEEEVAWAVNLLRARYGIECTQLMQNHKKNSYPYDKSYPYINVWKSGFPQLQGLVKDHLPDEMLFKAGLRLDLKPDNYTMGRPKGSRNR